MKVSYLTIIALLFFVSAYSQETTKADSSVLALKTYLLRHIRFPAVTRENNIQGRVIVAFKVDSNKKISDINILNPLVDDDDAEVVRTLMAYPNDVLMPPAEYSIGVQFLFEDRKHNSAKHPLTKVSIKISYLI